MNVCTPDKNIIEALANGSYSDVFSVLGAHDVNQKACIRVFQPHADSVRVKIDNKRNRRRMHRVDNSGFFVLKLDKIENIKYKLHFTHGSSSWESYDPYSFAPVLSDTDNYLITQGKRKKSDQILGANRIVHYGVEGIHFAVWAPNAIRVSVVGNFNGWDDRIHVMRHHPASGIWEIFIPELPDGEYYKYQIVNSAHEKLPLKADPYAFYCEKPPATSSIIWRKNNHDWRDGEWMDNRAKHQSFHAPISIYEVHLGSWRRNGDDNSYLDYRQLAHQLCDYVKEMGFTHLQIMPIAEYPFDGSWGYQPVSLYAPTSRFGNPDDFKYFIDYLHQHNIGIIVDWVAAHFPNDPHGLAVFDGSHVYEHADPRQGFHQDWNTCIYNYGRSEVRNFLIDNACFWLEEYHIDGLRVDAVASMLYLDYSRKDGEWIPNIHGGNENLEAIEFIRQFNHTVKENYPDVITIAEESTSWPGVTKNDSPVSLVFDYKWNMGWMHDTLNYLSKDAIHRKHHHNQMTFGIVYAFDENFVLPISHDEVVHGKGSLINKMSGDDWQKFASLRAYLAFMWTYPGKKLLFMGNEFAQFREWNHDIGLDWHLLEQDQHQKLRQLVIDLNKLYKTTPALHQLDCSVQGFRWIDADNSDESVYSYQRFCESSPPVIVVCNFTPIIREHYRISVNMAGEYQEWLNTDSVYYGGSNVGNLSTIKSETDSNGQHSLTFCLPPLACCVFSLKNSPHSG